MTERHVTVASRLGLHARASARLVHTANSFKSKITIRRIDNGRAVDAKSIFGVLMLAATRGTALIVSASGTDEVAATEVISTLIEASDGGKG